MRLAKNCTLLTSWDDGRKQDLRLAELLKKYNIPAIFFIPNVCELTDTEIRILSHHPGFEIGGHTVSHPQDIKLLSEEQIKFQVETNKQWLEDILTQKIRWFCYPRGRYDERVIKAVIKAGYKAARTTMVGTICIDENRPYQTHTSVHVYPDRAEYLGMKWYDYAKKTIEQAKVTRAQTVFHLWGHSWELDKFELWNELEEFFKYLTTQ